MLDAHAVCLFLSLSAEFESRVLQLAAFYFLIKLNLRGLLAVAVVAVAAAHHKT